MSKNTHTPYINRKKKSVKDNKKDRKKFFFLNPEENFHT